MSDLEQLPDDTARDPTMPDPRPPEEDDGTKPLMLTDVQRKEYLGRMVDFETRLSELPEKQANFVLAVLKDPTNYTAAARVAGYAYPNVEATRLLNNPKIAAAIAAGEQLREDRTMLTTDRTMHEFAICAFSDISNFEVRDGNIVTKPGVPTYAMRSISSLEIDQTEWMDEDVLHKRTKIKIRLWSKPDALKMVAMYQKLLSGDGGVNIGNLNIDQRTIEVHKHEHNTWDVGDGKKLTF